MANRRTLDEQIELAQKELETKEKRVKELLGRQRSKKDKERTNRLCRRGGQVEKLLPKLKLITDKQFDTFVEKTLLSGYAERILNEIMPTPPDEPGDNTSASGKTATPNPESSVPNPAVAAAQGNTPPTQKPAGAPYNGGNNNSGNSQPNNTRPANQPHNNGANGNGNGGNGGNGARPAS
jgi:hypothetical protein